MDKPTVILISCSEDGDQRIEVIQTDTFLKNLNAQAYGERPVFAKPGEKIEMDYFSGYILIKGEIIEPKPVDVVKMYTL